jgi:hypothetical protein
VVTKVDCWEKGLRVCLKFRTFEYFEFRAAFTDRKNTPTFAAVMVIFLPFSCLKLGRKFVVILAGRYSGPAVSAHYIALLMAIEPFGECAIWRMYHLATT